MDRVHHRSPPRRSDRPAENRFDFVHQQVRVSANYIVEQGIRIEKPPKAGDGRLLSLDLLTCELFSETVPAPPGEVASNGVTVPDDAYAFSPGPAGRTPWNPDTMTQPLQAVRPQNQYHQLVEGTSALLRHAAIDLRD